MKSRMQDGLGRQEGIKILRIECQSSEPMLMGQYEEILAIGDPELHENVSEVMPHRNITNVKAFGDILIF